MGVVDELVRQEGVQHRLDRGVGGPRVDQRVAQHERHVLVGQAVERAQLAQPVEPQRRHARFVDGGHIAAGGLHAYDLGHLAQEVGGERLDRGVAAAVQHQARLAAEQARRIDAQRQIRSDALVGIAIDDHLRVALGPRAFHCSSSRGQAAPAGRVPG